MTERMPVKIMGRTLGTAKGWDEAGSNVFIFYDFIPKEGVKIKQGDLQVNTETGTADIINKDGQSLDIIHDLIPILYRLPQDT